VETSQSWGNQKEEYANEINNYPKQLGNCDKIILIQQQSLKMKQDLADMTYQYNQYRETLNDPVRHKQLCQQSYTTSLSGSITKLNMPSLKEL
jgi:ribosome-associated toxin RatA of RatAB toxin-antitoxin module